MTASTHRYQSDFARRHYGQGQVDAVVTVLDARGIDVPADVLERITASTDLDQITTWVRRAVAVRTAQDLFADESP
jgi:hypothetical protein